MRPSSSFQHGVCVWIAGALSTLALASWARAEGSAAPPRACTLEAGVRELTLEVGGTERRYWVSVGPQAARSAAPPVIFLWHGFGSDGRWMLDALDPARDWPEGIAVAPQGRPRRIAVLGNERRSGWQLRAGELGDRDLELFDALLAAMSEQYCIDRSRVYSAGMSNGAYFSNLLACQRGRALAAIAPVAGGGPVPAQCAEPVAALVVHGRRDEIVPFRMGRDSLATWAALNRCELPHDLPSDGCVKLAGCSKPISFCAHAGGHVWPGDASASIVRFLRGLGE
jgi:polyhydroxybutyrate depolymerase